MVGSATGRPEIQLFAAGTPDALNRTVDVAALSSWLAVRAIDRETRRLDAIERGEPPPPAPAPISLPPPADAPDCRSDPPSEPLPQVPLPGRDPRRPPPKPKALGPRPPAAPSLATAPPPNPSAPVTSQQRRAAAAADRGQARARRRMKPKPRPPLALTPQVANPPPRPALQNSN